MPLRILMVAACPFPSRRGTPLRVQRLAEALVARGHAVEIATYGIAEISESTELLVHRAVPERVRPMPPGPHPAKVWLDPKLARLTDRLLEAGRFDLVHAHHVEGVFVSAGGCRRRRVPLVYDAHTLVGSELPTYLSRLRAPLATAGALVDRRACRLADGVVAVTPDIRDELVGRGLVPADRIVVAMNGVELGIFAPPSDARPESGTVFYSGTTAPYQDLDLLLHAFARAHGRLPGIRLVLSVSGDPAPLRPTLRELGIEDAVEILPDSFAELPARLHRAAVAALPRTRCHGIPQKLLNYMAAGRPVVASAGSAKVGRDGEHLLVVPDGDVEAFAEALLRLLRDRETAARIGGAARAFAEERCSWDRTARAVEELYARLLARRATEPATVLREAS